MAGLRQRGSSMYVALLLLSFLTADLFASSPDHSSSSQMLPPTRSPAIASQVSPSLGATLRDNYTTSPPYLHRNPHSPRHAYNHIPEIPRSVLPATMPLSPQPGSHYGSNASALLAAYPPVQNDRHETPPFDEQQNFYEIRTENENVTPKIEAKIEKGFFLSQDRVWTCYRRNYFSVQSSYSLNPHHPNERLYLSRGGNKPVEQIQALAMSLSAAVDGPTGKIIELIQHTPKRDKGPQLPIAKERLLPSPPGKAQADVHGYPLTSFHNSQNVASPFLPLQNETDAGSAAAMGSAGHSHNAYAHTFERIQFKSATANNGKRRAQQQYYHLIVELWADVRRTGETKPAWVKIAQRVSAAVVVRGRSPSHYSNEGPSTSGTSRQGGHGGAGSGSGGAGHTSYGGGTVGYRGNINNNLAGMMGSAYGGYRPGSTYSLNPSPVGSHSVSSASSISGGPVEGMVGDHQMEDVDSKPSDGYSYYPTALYDAGLHGSRHPDQTVSQHAIDESRKVKDEYTGPGFATTWPLAGHCGKYSSVNTSRGYYPDLQVQHTTY